MIPDLVDQVFGTGEEEPAADEYYPGSRHKLSERPSSGVEFSDPWQENYTTKLIHGVEMKMYPIGALANALGVSIQSIRSWERSGHIPLAPYRLPSNMIINGAKVSGRRLYTEPLIEAVVAAFEKRGLLGLPRIEWNQHVDLPIEIRESWSRIFNQTTTR